MPQCASAMTRAALVACALLPLRAAAQVIEPNGVAVPGASSVANEQSVQSFFDGLTPTESIDAVKDASPEPATFSPLCGFEAELVLSQSSAAAGLAWYNVPSDPSAAPSAIYPIVPETTMTGAKLSSAAIRGDANYAGGLIGFALTKLGGQPIYYSEFRRNAFCTQCSMPGNWRMMLAYASKLHANTYYLAFEDWEGANESGWPDDGDFNDKVFKLSGVRCAGGGEPCDTGKLGLCAHGVTSCASAAAPDAPSACRQLVGEQPERCDGLDDDCNGLVDDGQLCAPGEICERGQCLPACYGGEFNCASGATCVDGHCIDTACMAVSCDAGQVCRAGLCAAPCDGIVCPAGQECRGGACSDPCRGVSCAAGLLCRSGVCLEPCDCGGCPVGLACAAQGGQCVEPGCENLSCTAGTVCVRGTCKDACDGVRCPRGTSCANGTCGATGAAVSDAGNAGSAGSTGKGVAGPAVRAGGADAGSSSRSDGSVKEQKAASGCSCDIGPSPRSRPSPCLRAVCALALLVLAGLRSRSRAPARRVMMPP
jgi:hypothetical protein